MAITIKYEGYLPGWVAPEAAREAHLQGLGPSSSNRLRPEHCPAIIDASRLGFLVRSASEHSFFDNGDYDVRLHCTVDRVSGRRVFDTYDPCLVGSDESEPGYYKIATGLWVDVGEATWLLLPPLDPRLRLRGCVGSSGVIEPGYRGPLFAVVRPEGGLVIPAGTIVGQLVPLRSDSVLALPVGEAQRDEDRSGGLRLDGSPVVVRHSAIQSFFAGRGDATDLTSFVEARHAPD